MNREQKAAAIADIAARIDESHTIFAVDYRGISVPQVAELRGRLRDADASFKVVKNSLTERAADKSDAEALKELLTGPTALTFVRGDAATAAKAIADYGRAIQLLSFKGGLMDGAALDAEQIRALSRLPSREMLYGQLVGMVASPVTGLVRTLGALLGGLASALGQVHDKMQSGEIPAGAEAPVGEQQPPPAEEAADQPAPEAEGTAVQEQPAPAEEEAAGEPAAEAEGSTAQGSAEDQTEAPGEPAPEDDNQADAPAEAQSAAAEENPAKED